MDKSRFEIVQENDNLKRQVERLKQECSLLWNLVAESTNVVYIAAAQMKREREKESDDRSIG